MCFILISKIIFTNLFSRARLVRSWFLSFLSLREAAAGVCFLLAPIPTFRSVLLWNYDFCGSYVTKARLIKLRWCRYQGLLRRLGLQLDLTAWKWFLTVIDWLFRHIGANHVRFCQKCPDSYSDCGRPETKVDRKQSLARINRENIKIVSKR